MSMTWTYVHLVVFVLCFFLCSISFSTFNYWLGLLTCKNRLPYNLYCVGGDVKHCTIRSKNLDKSWPRTSRYQNFTTRHWVSAHYFAKSEKKCLVNCCQFVHIFLLKHFGDKLLRMMLHARDYSCCSSVLMLCLIHRLKQPSFIYTHCWQFRWF